MNNYYKYLKYKNKYLNLKNNSQYNISGGGEGESIPTSNQDMDYVVRCQLTDDDIRNSTLTPLLYEIDRKIYKLKNRTNDLIYSKQITIPSSNVDKLNHNNILNLITQILVSNVSTHTTQINMELLTSTQLNEFINDFIKGDKTKSIGIILIYSLNETSKLVQNNHDVSIYNEIKTYLNDTLNKACLFGVNENTHGNNYPLNYSKFEASYYQYFYSHATYIADKNIYYIISCMPSSNINKYYCDFRTYQNIYDSILSSSGSSGSSSSDNSLCAATYTAMCLFYSFYSLFYNGKVLQIKTFIISLKYICAQLTPTLKKHITKELIDKILYIVLTQLEYTDITIKLLDDIVWPTDTNDYTFESLTEETRTAAVGQIIKPPLSPFMTHPLQKS